MAQHGDELIDFRYNTFIFDHAILPMVHSWECSGRSRPDHQRLWLDSLRTLDDAAAIAERMRGARTVAIVGGGFIGCELASTARQLALDVTIVDISPTLLTRALGPAVGSA